ncbi:lysozyme family protein [Thalassobacillus pellis]|uniref:lysozyme family protein n=1 Tax=Thalassobacillus pellis TaxID=748008 RepID=UPI00195F7240|nr:lysozyme family protein [Thalassobacillus pellis]MBM7554821.1 murein DD-endopeptidase MepM/ murein hydrolase activator NlpD [Thalassobacillus pellis]
MPWSLVVGLVPRKVWLWLMGVILVLCFLLMVLFTSAITTLIGFQKNNSNENVESVQLVNGKAQISKALEQYRPLFEKYAAKYGVSEYVELLLAKTMQESGGRLADVMQASESLGLPPNTIQDPERSIKVGIRYFANMLEKAGGDVKVAIQAYNFGGGFIDYANKYNNGEYSKEIAIEFSRMKYQELKHTGMYSCIRPEATATGACYGDIGYVEAVLSYLEGGTVNADAQPTGEWIMPIGGALTQTSDYGMRSDPFDGSPAMHRGIDFVCTNAVTPIQSVDNGEVVEVERSNSGYGKNVLVKHEEGLYSHYAHLYAISVQNGEVLQRGDEIGKCGTTGDSTGPHLHFEVMTTKHYGSDVNPAPYLGL